MENKTITIELTPKQFEKMESLKKEGISVGEVIEKFALIQAIYLSNDSFVEKELEEINKRKEKLEKELDSTNKELRVFTMLKDKTLQYEDKQAFIEEEFSQWQEGDFQKTIQRIKQDTKFNDVLKK